MPFQIQIRRGSNYGSRFEYPYLLLGTAHIKLRGKSFEFFHVCEIALHLHVEHQYLGFISMQMPEIQDISIRDKLSVYLTINSHLIRDKW